MNNFKIDGTIRCYFDNYINYVKNYDDMESVLKLNISKLNEVKETKLTSRSLYFCLIYWIMTRIGILLLIIFSVIMLVIIMSIIYTIKFYKDRNCKYFSMLLSIGMYNNERMKIYVVEFILMFFLASMFGTYFSIVLLNLFNSITTLTLDFH